MQPVQRLIDETFDFTRAPDQLAVIWRGGLAHAKEFVGAENRLGGCMALDEDMRRTADGPAFGEHILEPFHELHFFGGLFVAGLDQFLGLEKALS